MKPKRVEFDIGPNIFGQPVSLILDRSSDGRNCWYIHRGQGDQRDDTQSVGGLTAEQIRSMAAAVNMATAHGHRS